MNENLILKVDDIPVDIFSSLYDSDKTLYSWLKTLYGDNIDVAMEHYKIHSSEKWLSYRISKLFENDKSQTIISYISYMFGRKWTRYWDTLELNYTPNENVKISENVSHNLQDVDKRKEDKLEENVSKNSRNFDTIEDKTHNKDTSNVSKDSSQSSSKNVDTTDDASSSAEAIYGFNSDAGVDSNRTDDRSVSKNTTDNTSSDNSSTVSSNTENLKEKNSTNSQERNDESSIRAENNNINRQLDRESSTSKRRNGLDGSSNQQLLTEELELRKTLFLDIVFNDIDSFITIPCY